MLIETVVTSAQIYRRGCLISRSGMAELPEGRSQLLLAGMTPTADRDSLRLAFPEGVSGTSIQILDAGELAADADSDSIRQELEHVEQRIAACEAQRELWQANGNFQQRSQMDTEELERYLDALPKRLEEIFLRLRELNGQKRHLERQLEKRRTMDEGPKVLVDLVAREPMRCPFTMRYLERSAGWTPRYEIHFSGEDAPLSVRLRGRISQNTGEDWQQAELTLCSGNPAAPQEIPELPTRRLRLNEPVQPRSNATMMMGMAMSAMPKAAMAGAAPALSEEAAILPLATPEADEQSRQTMTAYVLPGRKDVSSGGPGSMADLRSYTVDAAYQLLAVPGRGASAWMTAEISTADWPLPDARAAVYLQNSYAGEVAVCPDKTRVSFLLSLGTDERISVKREKTNEHTSDALLKNRRSRALSFELRISARQLSRPARLLIRDQIPVSTDKSIQVDATELSGAQLEKDSGILTWEIELDGQVDVVKKLSYTISWPKDKTYTETVDKPRHTGGAFDEETLWRCDNCGHFNAAATRFCANCGAKR